MVAWSASVMFYLPLQDASGMFAYLFGTRRGGITAAVRDERLLSSYVFAQVEDLWTTLHQTVSRT
jgi:hypothetical protein